MFPTHVSHLLPPLAGQHGPGPSYISQSRQTQRADVLPATLHGSSSARCCTQRHSLVMIYCLAALQRSRQQDSCKVLHGVRVWPTHSWFPDDWGRWEMFWSQYLILLKGWQHELNFELIFLFDLCIQSSCVSFFWAVGISLNVFVSHVSNKTTITLFNFSGVEIVCQNPLTVTVICLFLSSREISLWWHCKNYNGS